jgi:hypothetical protein
MKKINRNYTNIKKQQNKPESILVPNLVIPYHVPTTAHMTLPISTLVAIEKVKNRRRLPNINKNKNRKTNTNH